MGAESYNSISSFDGIPSVYIGIKGTPSASPLDVIKEDARDHAADRGTTAAGPEGDHRLRRHRVHPGVHRRGGEDLAEAAVIVIVVVFLFLGSLRTVLIPVVTIRCR